MSTAEHTSMEPEESALDSTAVDSATTAAAAAMGDLSALPSPAVDGAPFPPHSSVPRQTADGMAACERCGRQLSKMKHHRPHGVGRACAPRCKEVKRSLDTGNAPLHAAATHKPKKQRAASDPGLSHAQLRELRGMLKEDGVGKQGHTRSPSDNARALLHVAVHQQHGLSYDAAIKATAAAELASPHTIRVLDNASYHKPRDESWVSSSKAQNKHELAHQLMDLGVEELTTVDDSRRVVPSHRFEAKVSDGGPSKEDLINAIQKWLDGHPDYNRTVVEQLMDDAGHSLIYTPPFCPEVQPIELLWAAVKRYVRDRSTHNRSTTEAREHAEQGFEQITAMFCNEIVKHCHDWIDRFLATDDAEDLQQCGTLAGVIKHLSLLKAASTEGSAITTAQPISIQPAAPIASSARTLRRRH